MKHIHSKLRKFSVLHYLIQSLSHPKKTGSITPSSKKLSNLITDKAQLNKLSIVVEFGSGNGAFTEKILEKLADNAIFFALEINPEFAEVTKQRCPKAIVYNDSAQNVKHYLKKHGKESCDCIISGLPWTIFESSLQSSLLRTAYDILKPGGKLLTMIYIHRVPSLTARGFKTKLYNTFPIVTKSKTVWLNIPPAFIYCAEKTKKLLTI